MAAGGDEAPHPDAERPPSDSPAGAGSGGDALALAGVPEHGDMMARFEALSKMFQCEVEGLLGSQKETAKEETWAGWRRETGSWRLRCGPCAQRQAALRAPSGASWPTTKASSLRGSSVRRTEPGAEPLGGGGSPRGSGPTRRAGRRTPRCARGGLPAGQRRRRAPRDSTGAATGRGAAGARGSGLRGVGAVARGACGGAQAQVAGGRTRPGGVRRPAGKRVRGAGGEAGAGAAEVRAAGAAGTREAARGPGRPTAGAAEGEKSDKIIELVRRLEEQSEQVRLLSDENNTLRLELGRDADYSKALPAPADPLSYTCAAGTLSDELKAEDPVHLQSLAVGMAKGARGTVREPPGSDPFASLLGCPPRSVCRRAPAVRVAAPDPSAVGEGPRETRWRQLRRVGDDCLSDHARELRRVTGGIAATRAPAAGTRRP
ncbi:unnamed protein product [Prorocentrum cordatum]|uniref:Uncharacterized protein n=1 Tax=Prorocentrum cordatum TaxID=2364126 RepID=A0ABN9TCW2_9DINO|nr:unnamed protein product [Polarella glacialis]